MKFKRELLVGFGMKEVKKSLAFLFAFPLTTRSPPTVYGVHILASKESLKGV